MKQIISTLLLCAVVLLLCAAPASAAPSKNESAMSTYILGDPQELEKFMDIVMKSQLRKQNIAGAVVVVVQDNQVLLAKGYGYSDIEQHPLAEHDRVVEFVVHRHEASPPGLEVVTAAGT